MGPGDVDSLLRTVFLAACIVCTILVAAAFGIAIGVTFFDPF
jgi:hypothetical protein